MISIADICKWTLFVDIYNSIGDNCVATIKDMLSFDFLVGLIGRSQPLIYNVFLGSITVHFFPLIMNN